MSYHSIEARSLEAASRREGTTTYSPTPEQQAELDAIQIPVIDWSTYRKGDKVIILPNEWAKIIMHLQFLNDFRIRRDLIGVIYERAPRV